MPRPLGAKCSVTLALERDTMGNPRFLVTRSPKGRGLAPIGILQHQICRVRPFLYILRRKAIFFWVLCGAVGTLGTQGQGASQSIHGVLSHGSVCFSSLVRGTRHRPSSFFFLPSLET